MQATTTAIEDPINFNVKHPLKNKWTLWFDAPSKKTAQKDWEDNLKNIITIDTVEDFWGVYNNLVKTAELVPPTNYHLFKEGIKPAWEDVQNNKGGKWAYQLSRQKRGPELDQLWLTAVLACIGENFTFNDEITGIVVSIRKAQDRISIWTRNASDKEKTIQIGKEMKKFLNITEKLGYQSHADAAVKRSRARCGKCVELITGKCVSALDAKWHLEHFVCDDCGRSLVGASFVRKNDKPCCKNCPMNQPESKDQTQSTCATCKQPLNSEMIFYKGQKYHPHHYKCAICKKELDSRAKEYEQELYCSADYQKLMSQTCFGCRRPITGRSVTALGKIYHPEHFFCFKCEIPFHGSRYFEYQSRPYCEQHYKEAIGAVCPYCWEASAGVVINALGAKWCEKHFMCMGCLVHLADEKSKFVDCDNKPMCKYCFDKLPADTKRHIAKYRELEKKLNPFLQ